MVPAALMAATMTMAFALMGAAFLRRPMPMARPIAVVRTAGLPTATAIAALTLTALATTTVAALTLAALATTAIAALALTALAATARAAFAVAVFPVAAGARSLLGGLVVVSHGKARQGE